MFESEIEQNAHWVVRYFPPQTVLQLHKFEAQEKPMHYKYAKKFEKRRTLIQFSPFLKETPRLFLLR